MSKKGIVQNMLVIVLGVAIICMSVGYAVYDNPEMSATSPTIGAETKWEVKLADPAKTINSTVALENVKKVPVIGENANNVFFDVVLKPNDVYEISLNVENSGTLDAMLTSYDIKVTQNGIEVPIVKASEVTENTILSYDIVGLSANEIIKRDDISTKIIKIMAHNTDASAPYEFEISMNYIPANN